MDSKKVKVSIGFNIMSAVMALIIWGGWAYYVNADSALRLTSALAQGLSSFCITILLVYMVTYVFNLLPATAMRVVLPAIISASISAIILVLIHTIVGTSKIWFTITPALCVAFSFCLFTAIKLHRE